MHQRWQLRFLSLAKHVSTWSKDPSTKVGAVLVDRKLRVLGLGYNGFPRGVHDWEDRYQHRDLKYDMIVHAEANAILNSTGITEGSSLFLWPFMSCSRCAGLVIQASIAEVYYPTHQEGTPEYQSALRWKDNIGKSLTMFQEAGIIVHGFQWEEK